MKRLLLLVFILTFSGSVFGMGAHFWFGKNMIVSKAELKWGKELFVLEKFKAGTVADRAKMAASLVRGQKAWNGRPMIEIRDTFGQHDGFYFTDSIPAYLIQVPEKKGDEAWQVVFLPDNERIIKDIIIHKNCCN